MVPNMTWYAIQQVTSVEVIASDVQILDSPKPVSGEELVEDRNTDVL